MPKRRATATSSSASRRSSLSRSAKSKKMGPSASAPANTIVLREEPPLHISFEVGSIVDADTEVVAVSCNSEVHMNNHIFAEVCKIGGTQIPSLIDAAKNALPRNALHSGQVVAVDVSETPLKPKHLLLVINPDGFHINMAWRGVLTKAQDLGCESIAVAGMGCGGLQVDPIKSATRFRTVVGEMLESEKFTTLKRISFRDVNQQLAATFENVFSQGLAAATNDSAGTEDAFSCYLNDVPANLVTKDENCVVCMDSLTDSGDNVVALKKCSHQFHKSCFAMMMNQGGTRKCPTCQIYFALPEGNMPRGSRMRFHYIRDRIQIEGGSGYIKLEYDIPGGIQGDEHLRPGTPFCGTQRTAYLPNTQEGKKVLRLLEKAFECRLTFTVGDSVTTGAQNVVVWNNIHHKTSLSGGPTSFGYPDPDYLVRVTEELRNAGITEELLNQSA